MERAAGNPLFLQSSRASGRRPTRPRSFRRRSKHSSRRASTSSARATARSCAGRPFSASRSRDRSSPRCSRTTPRSAPASEAWERLGEFVERDPDVPGAFRFRHALIRDAAYEGLSYKTTPRAPRACRRGHRASPRRAAQKTRPRFSRSTSTAPSVGRRPGATPSRRVAGQRRSTRTSRLRSSSSRRSTLRNSFATFQAKNSRGQPRRWATSACSSADTRRHVRRSARRRSTSRTTPFSTPALPRSATGCRYGSASPPKRFAG